MKVVRVVRVGIDMQLFIEFTFGIMNINIMIPRHVLYFLSLNSTLCCTVCYVCAICCCAACARAFYRAGCKVILCARRADQLQRVANELKLLQAVRLRFSIKDLICAKYWICRSQLYLKSEI